MGDPRKKIGLLCLLLLASGSWIAFASRQGEAITGPQTEEGGAIQGRDAGNSLSDPRPSTPGPSSFWSDPNGPSSAGLSLGNGELFLRMMLAVGLILGLGAVALYLSKRALPRVGKAGGKEIHVLETAYLGPRKALHLVEVSGQRLLIASTSDRVTMLTSVNETWLDLPKTEVAEAVKA
jgi:flagellar biogenesis protein FliO